METKWSLVWSVNESEQREDSSYLDVALMVDGRSQRNDRCPKVLGRTRANSKSLVDVLFS